VKELGILMFIGGKAVMLEELCKKRMGYTFRSNVWVDITSLVINFSSVGITLGYGKDDRGSIPGWS
jgi:hypothetical protein